MNSFVAYGISSTRTTCLPIIRAFCRARNERPLTTKKHTQPKRTKSTELPIATLSVTNSKAATGGDGGTIHGGGGEGEGGEDGVIVNHHNSDMDSSWLFHV